MQDARIAIGDEATEVDHDPEIEPDTVQSYEPNRWRWPALLTLAFLSGAAIVWSTAERTLGELKASLAAAEMHRTASDAIRTELVAEVAAQRQAMEAAERKTSTLEAELAAKRVAEEKQPVPATAPVPPPTAEPPPPESKPSPTAVAFASPQFSAVVVPEQAAGTAEDALSEGRRHLQSGDLQAARQSFERAAELGLPEGALAMGTTFDPVALSKAGLADKGTAHEAQRWYRRAYELSGKASP